ncbi:MAG: exodeoxyribonuclease VII large subunit, partial [Clostridiales bacterium]
MSGSRKILETVSVTVSQLNRYIKSVMDPHYNLRTVFVRGEISNFSPHPRTGHFY